MSHSSPGQATSLGAFLQAIAPSRQSTRPARETICHACQTARRLGSAAVRGPHQSLPVARHAQRTYAQSAPMSAGQRCRSHRAQAWWLCSLIPNVGSTDDAVAFVGVYLNVRADHADTLLCCFGVLLSCCVRRESPFYSERRVISHDYWAIALQPTSNFFADLELAAQPMHPLYSIQHCGTLRKLQYVRGAAIYGSTDARNVTAAAQPIFQIWQLSSLHQSGNLAISEHSSHD